jgi:XTP/dITP diphosphohydrolase
MKKLVLATHNKDKAIELKTLLAPSMIEVLTQDAFPAVGEVVEDGETLEENALKKARAVSHSSGLPALADDSGLEIFYLNGAPGLRSARFSGPNATYESNVKLVLDLMKGVPPRRRGARFRCVLAFVMKEIEEIVEGICEGSITESPDGINGFGYDPIFLPKGHKETFASMNPELKNRISHRAMALSRIRPLLLHLDPSLQPP